MDNLIKLLEMRKEMESSFQIGHCFYETLMNQKQGCNCGKGKIEVNNGMSMIWL
jgi:hypothetical protein